MTTTPELVRTYFQHAVDPDLEFYFQQFTPDATVEDEGHEHRGIDAIRRWRTSVPPVRYEVQTVEGDASGSTATALISGDFPGSPVTLHFGFRFDGDRIQALTIRA